jgi:hypothetical protein
MVGVAPAAAALARARTGARVRRRPWTRATPFSRQGVRAQWRGLVVVHGFVTLFLEVIKLAIILFLVWLFVLVVLVFATRVIVALIILMTIIMLLVFAIALVASLVVAILAPMLPVAQIMGASDGKMSCFFSFGCFFS